ncbi:MAG TPA: hypothetical protein VN668_09650 [Stellaceae bacterium]|nr:hypothetical protein [Stellaceae bacterium]
MVMSDLIGNDWDTSWEGVRGRGREFWRMRSRQIAEWDAVFNIWKEGGAPSIAIV